MNWTPEGRVAPVTVLCDHLPSRKDIDLMKAGLITDKEIAQKIKKAQRECDLCGPKLFNK